MDKAQRPPNIQVELTPEEVANLQKEIELDRDSSLLPGMLRTPSRLFGLGTEVDWAAPGSTVWEEDDKQPQKTVQTPLTGYGHSSEVWASTTASPLLNDGEEAAGTFDGPNGGAHGASEDKEVHPRPERYSTAAALAAAALRALGVDSTPNPRDRGPFSTSAANAASGLIPTTDHHHHHPTAAAATAAATATVATAADHPHTAQSPPFFTVQEGRSSGSERAPVSGGHPGGITVTDYRGPAHSPSATAATGGDDGYEPTAGSGLPTLEDKQVAQSIIASAGLPLSMASLVEYIRDGQPQFEERDAGGQDAAIYGTTSAQRNYPNPSEPPLPPQQAMGGGGGGGGGYGYGSGGPGGFYTQGPVYGEDASQGGQGFTANPANDNWMGVNEGGSTDGGWNVQANSPVPGPANPLHGHPPPFDAGMGYGYHGVRVGGEPNRGAYRHPHARGNAGGFHLPPTRYSQQPPYQHQHHHHQQQLQQQLPQQQQQQQPSPRGHYGGGGGHPARPKSESEILSDLLHFHANFFPPPPPPRVPNEQKRGRAALWYHYASKWDITHRLPPPPRNPLPEMELEYIMQLPEMSRVPYHGDGWLNMSERWFAVTQSLFDFPDENVGLELDASVVVDQAVTT